MTLDERRDALFARLQPGNDAFARARYAEAAAAYEAVVADLGPEDDPVAPLAFENLGLAYWFAGRIEAAERALLRACDGPDGACEQALRFLVLCAFRQRRPYDAQRRLTRYEALFGPHPDGLDAERIAEAIGQWRREMRLATPS